MTSMVPIGGNYVVDADNFIDQDALQGVITVLHRAISISIFKQKIVPLDDGNTVTPEDAYLLEPLLAYKSGIVDVPYYNEVKKYSIHNGINIIYPNLDDKVYISNDNKLLWICIVIFAIITVLIHFYL